MAVDLGTPMSPGALVTAAGWLQQSVTGYAAMALGVIAIAALGLAMFNGQLPMRRGLVVVAGCFLLFDSVGVSRGLVALLDGNAGSFQAATVQSEYRQQPLPEVPTKEDPYAGAGLVRPE